MFTKKGEIALPLFTYFYSLLSFLTQLVKLKSKKPKQIILISFSDTKIDYIQKYSINYVTNAFKVVIFHNRYVAF